MISKCEIMMSVFCMSKNIKDANQLATSPSTTRVPATTPTLLLLGALNLDC